MSNNEKRQIYGAFLAGAIKSPNEPFYDEQLRFLRALCWLGGPQSTTG